MNKYFILFLFCLFVACKTNEPVAIQTIPSQTIEAPESTANLSPTQWGDGEFDKYIQMDNRALPSNPAAVGTHGAVTTTFHSAASRAGLEALKQGGSSVDAAMTTALTQIAMNAGSVISYFGIMNMVHYDAASGNIVSMDATWNSVLEETEPMSIPGSTDYTNLFAHKEPSGRTALVGGFMKGLEEAHERFGKLPFAQLFQPAIFIAEEGIVLSDDTADFFQKRDDILRRLPETKATLIKSNGEMYEAGDVFKQPALAKSLTQVSQEGADYMYKGAWGKKLIATVQAEGGKMTMTDLADYQVIWNEPRRANYGEYELAVSGPPAHGSVNLIEALNLAHVADIKSTGHWSESGASLNKILDVTNMYSLSFLPQATLKYLYPTLDLTHDSRVQKETSQQLWKVMQEKANTAKDQGGSKHSDTVIAIDKNGNMTAVTHSINCVVWGSTGIVVDGISIGDAASFQQMQLGQIQPGDRLPSPIEVGILSKHGKPILPFASMSTGLHQETTQALLNLMMFDMDIESAVNAPSIFLPLADYANPISPTYTVRVMEGAFPKKVLEESELSIQEIPANERRYAQGLWVGIYKDPNTGQLKAVSPPYATGCALAY